MTHYIMIYILHPLQATIFDSPLNLTKDSACVSPGVKMYPENIGIAVGILLLSCILAEIICVFEHLFLTKQITS